MRHPLGGLPPADFPAPSDAEGGTVGEWKIWDDEHYGRCFIACTSAVALLERTVTVKVNGWQSDTGEVQRIITVEGAHGMELTARQAMAFSAALSAAAAHIDNA